MKKKVAHCMNYGCTAMCVQDHFPSWQGVDGDPPNTANSRLSFSLTSSPLFTINATSGQISASALDYEAVASHMYGLTVTVSDAGTSALSATCTVTVNIRVSSPYLYSAHSDIAAMQQIPDTRGTLAKLIVGVFSSLGRTPMMLLHSSPKMSTLPPLQRTTQLAIQ